MLTTGATVLPCKVKCLHEESLCRFQPAAILKTGLFLANISKKKNEQLFQRNQTCLPSLISAGGLGLQTNRNRKLNNMVVCCRLESRPPPFPFNFFPGSNNWQPWVLGTVLSVILPFTTSKWGPLLKLKNQADNILEVAEQISDVVEEVAEKVEKIADEVGDQLPDGGKLQATLEVVEDLAEETAKNARLAGDLIDKVQEMEDKLESFMESVDAKSNEKPNKT
ncbi:uncharacterized protein LOC111314932 [Durio zibethinus]|uniref:Uncharacterized protein LOC111314932 n=1 Tax=Durio zibethinus TaxID=66656 RepID=A0A6P6B557_DURZI|nr:uncharacterized protein LOC111314932 [Durio zibethinus]